ncbi:hypothetical protein PYS58_12545 [Chryseobacterium indologenes]|uniref:hypothetical protein n=1 Tax=Chryseobacterium indologenes TaxID=253 RepID=UPI0023E7E504|nr:hypothetical protein [Chryseobacterium indologenes]WET47414.1 hypothetical protein PYS58_12545 [Chryseobacterium indologenes]
MRIEFDIPDEKVTDLNPNGRTELTRHCKQWTEDIIDEATRIEASRNVGTSTEITAAIISEAATYSKRFPLRSKSKWWVKVIQIVAFISSLIAGSLLDVEKFKEVGHVVWFIITLFIAVATTVFLTFNSEKNG